MQIGICLARTSPSEALFDKVHDAKLLHIAHGLAHIVSQAPGPAHSDAHGADLLALFLAQQQAAVGATGKHLHRLAGAAHLERVARPRDEELDGEYVASVRYLQDFVHPWSDPLEVLEVTDGPDEGDFAGCDGAVVVPGEEVR